MTYAALRSIASYVPKNCVTNFDFEKTLDTNDEWIVKRTGIKTRYFADENEHVADMGTKAAKLAIERANLTPNDIDLIICATLSSEFFYMPSNACVISAKLGLSDKPAFDISAACTGFIYLLAVAKSFIESNAYKNVLVIGSEKISSILDFTDRGTCVLFGDGAGAAVISATSNKAESIIDTHISADGNFTNYLKTPRAKIQSTDGKEKIAGGFVEMKGNELFKLAVKALINDVDYILEKNNIAPSQVTHFIPHQANLRIIEAVAKHLDFKEEQLVLTVQKYGNTSAASIPMAMDDLYQSGKLKNGDLMLLDAFGGGITWGSALVHFAGN